MIVRHDPSSFVWTSYSFFLLFFLFPTLQMLIGGAVSYVAGKQAVRTVYWRTASNGRLLKTAKTCMFQGPPKPAPSSTSAFEGQSHMDPIPKDIFNHRNWTTNPVDNMTSWTKETGTGMGEGREGRGEGREGRGIDICMYIALSVI